MVDDRVITDFGGVANVTDRDCRDFRTSDRTVWNSVVLVLSWERSFAFFANSAS